MRVKATAIVGAFALSSLVALTGCDKDKATVQLHEPGKYLGPTDPLAKKGATDEEALKKRFASIQTDR